MASPPKYGSVSTDKDVKTKPTNDWDIFGFFKSDQRLDRVEVEDDMFDDNHDVIPNPSNIIEIEDDLFDDTQPDPLDPKQYVEVEDDLFDDNHSFWFPTNMGQEPSVQEKPKFQEVKPIKAPPPAQEPNLGNQDHPLFGPEAGAYTILQKFAEVGNNQAASSEGVLQAPPEPIAQNESNSVNAFNGNQRSNQVKTSYEVRAEELARRDREELGAREVSNMQPDEVGRAGIGIAIAPHVQGAVVVAMERGGAAELSGKMAVGDLILSANGRDLAGKAVIDVVNELTGPEGTYCVLLTRTGIPPFPTQTVVLSRTSNYMNEAGPKPSDEAKNGGNERAEDEVQDARDGEAPQMPYTADFSQSFLRDWAIAGVFNEEANQKAIEEVEPAYAEVASEVRPQTTGEHDAAAAAAAANARRGDRRLQGSSEDRPGSMTAEIENRMLKYELEELYPGASKQTEPKSIFDQLGDMMAGMTTSPKPKSSAPARDMGNEPPLADEYLSVTVVEARNVPSEDLVGMNAHFCRVRSGLTTYCTKNQRWSLNPAFDKVFLLPLSNNKDLSIELMEVPLLGGAEKRIGFVDFNLFRLLEDVRRQPVSGLQTMRYKDEPGAVQILQGTAVNQPCQLLLSFELVKGPGGS